MNDPGHPLWSFLRYVVIATVAIIGMYLNASNFDATELKALLWILGGMAGIEGAGQVVRKFSKHE